MINVATAARGPSRQNHWSTPRRRGGRRDGVHLHAVDARRGALNLGPRRGLHDRRGETIQIPARTRSWRACGGVRWRCDVKDALDLFGPQPVSRRRALQQTSRRRRGGRPARPRTGAASMAWRSSARPSRRAASMAWRPSRVSTLGRVQAFHETRGESTSDGLVRLKSKAKHAQIGYAERSPGPLQFARRATRHAPRGPEIEVCVLRSTLCAYRRGHTTRKHTSQST
jgi:hypothetical protein